MTDILSSSELLVLGEGSATRGNEPMLYAAYQAQRDLMGPVRILAGMAKMTLDHLPFGVTNDRWVKRTSAVLEMTTRAGLSHIEPHWGIDRVTINDQVVEVREEPTSVTPFGTLLHFAKDTDIGQPRVLVVAAMAGHFPTLLRPTVAALLPDHDVYITDWHNARDVPADAGRFGLDEYIAHVIAFLEDLGPGTHVLAVCQPCPAALAATAIMAADGNPAQPRSLTLMAGPVDTRISPTAVNDMAMSTPLEWFEDNVITSVPFRYAGAFRRVYPGFIQLSAFMSMNLGRHVKAHTTLLGDLADGNEAEAAVIKAFYDEYFAVLDMHAEFYLETVRVVFQEQLLAKGEMEWQGQKVNPALITNTALLTVEGEKDDVCGLGQTLAAHDLCTGIDPSKKRHHLQVGVGHYGVFGGSRWEREIYPVVRNFILTNA